MYRVFYQSADADPVPLCSVFDLILEFEDSHLPPLTDDRPDDASVLPHGNGFEVATASDASILESLPMHFHNLVRGAVLADVRPSSRKWAESAHQADRRAFLAGRKHGAECQSGKPRDPWHEFCGSKCR